MDFNPITPTACRHQV